MLSISKQTICSLINHFFFISGPMETRPANEYGAFLGSKLSDTFYMAN